MSLRLELLQAARLAPNLLREAGDCVVPFLRAQFNEDGGCRNRSGESDLYYTVFGLAGLQAMGAVPPLESVLRYLDSFSNGSDPCRSLDDLDFVHQTCLARCWATTGRDAVDTEAAHAILRHVESHRSADGGYGARPGAETGTAYHGLLALGAYQDLDAEVPQRRQLAGCLDRLRADDGAYANEPGLKLGTTPATAAAVTLLRHLDVAVPPEAGEWLLARCSAAGGFLATPNAPLPDLLSTATALHALAKLNLSLDPVRDTCLDFLDSLWTGEGFRGHWADNVPDCEYTYYALLALGHLSS